MSLFAIVASYDEPSLEFLSTQQHYCKSLELSPLNDRSAAAITPAAANLVLYVVDMTIVNPL